MPIPDDLKRWIARNFPAPSYALVVDKIEKAVDHTGQLVGARLQRCVALASRGDLAKLDYYLQLLRTDYRDVIVAGEYEVSDKQLLHKRDLNTPIAASD